MKSMSELNTQRLSIPVGTLFGGELLTGRGPKLPLKLMISNSVLSEFKNSFDEAGINQTRHEIMLELTADIYVVLPGYKTSAQVKTNISVAETIIVGKVPDTYADLNRLDQVLR
jgi:sporulation protein YunB